MDKKINEIPFGETDSELYKFEYTIPEGYEAEIKDGKVIVKKKESEDERIRKAIGAAICGTTAETILEANGVKLVDALAYLEKQKDASYAIEAVDRIDKYIDEHLANAHDMKDSNPDKKYYRGWDDALGKMAGILQDVYSDEKQKEQNPAEWSEKDERIKQDIENLIHFALRDGSAVSPAAETTKEDALNWLKSLRPQPHWKPSEEQIEALENSTALNEEQGAHLYSLLCDLKKLL